MRYTEEFFQVRKVTFNPCICNKFTHAPYSVLISSNVLLGSDLKYTHTTSDVFPVHTLQYKAPNEGCADVSGAISFWDFVSLVQQSPMPGHTCVWELCGTLGGRWAAVPWLSPGLGRWLWPPPVTTMHTLCWWLWKGWAFGHLLEANEAVDETLPRYKVKAMYSFTVMP